MKLKEMLKQRRQAIHKTAPKVRELLDMTELQVKQEVQGQRAAGTLRQLRDFVFHEQEIVVEQVDSESDQEIPNER